MLHILANQMTKPNGKSVLQFYVGNFVTVKTKTHFLPLLTSHFEKHIPVKTFKRGSKSVYCVLQLISTLGATLN